MKKDITSIKGIVVPGDWEPDGTVSAVDIVGYDEKKYRVAGDQIGLRLFELIKKPVIVQGVLQSGSLLDTIHVDHYQLDTSRDLCPSEGIDLSIDCNSDN